MSSKHASRDGGLDSGSLEGGRYHKENIWQQTVGRQLAICENVPSVLHKILRKLAIKIDKKMTAQASRQQFHFALSLAPEQFRF